MVGDGERGHRCRVCSKSFSTGRSLGGHMRSHVVMNSMEVAVEKEEEKKIRSSVGVVNGYGLRENPRKTKRFTISLKKRFEKECGDSLKSLSGEMRYVDDDDHHGQEDGEEDEQEEEEEEEEEGSWSVLSDNEATGLVIPAKKKRSRRMSMAMEAQASSSSALEQEEQEDVALALMMLSRDTGHWNVSESSDKNSVADEEQQQLLVSENDFGFKKKKQKMIVSDDNDSSEQCDSRKRSKYECSTCKKSFQSYQALGGHRAAHKRYTGGCPGLRIDENGIENTNSDASMDVLDAKKSKSHECLICGKCFSSGQALGGHKRSHLALSSIDAAGGSDQNAVIPDLIASSSIIDGRVDQNAVIPDLIDLNLPAPVDDESKFKNWWNCDAAVGLISN